MERLGLVGLPNAGKSSLFNAMTGASVPVAAHPFSTTETHVGIAQVPDPRLRALAEMSKSRKVVGATLEFVDIAGLVAGSKQNSWKWSKEPSLRGRLRTPRWTRTHCDRCDVDGRGDYANSRSTRRSSS